MTQMLSDKPSLTWHQSLWQALAGAKAGQAGPMQVAAILARALDHDVGCAWGVVAVGAETQLRVLASWGEAVPAPGDAYRVTFDRPSLVVPCMIGDRFLGVIAAAVPPSLTKKEARALLVSLSNHLSHVLAAQWSGDGDDLRWQDAQAALHKAERLSTMAVLSAGLTHELTNPVFVARAHLEGLADLLPFVDSALGAIDRKAWHELEALAGSEVIANGREQIRMAMTESLRALQQVNRILEQIKAGARQPTAGEIGDLQAVVTEVAQLVRLSYGKSVRIDASAPSIALSAEAADSLRQVLTNLMVNACQATGHGGEVRIDAAVDADRVTIRVGNDGQPIPAEVLPHLFEPFYTTKSPEEGTGLGLPISRRLMQLLGGELEVSSTEDWTEFRVLLPLRG